MALEIYKKNLQEKVLFKIRNYRLLIKPSLGKNSLMFIHIGKNAGTHINNISSKLVIQVYLGVLSVQYMNLKI